MKIFLKNNQAITLITLSITIILILILSSTATYTGLNVLSQSRFVKFSTELQIMQTNVNSWYSETNSNQQVTFIEENSDDVIQQSKIALYECNIINSPDNNYDFERFAYYPIDLIKNLGVEGISRDFIVDTKNKTAISLYGITYKGNIYHMLSQLPDNKYTVTEL